MAGKPKTGEGCKVLCPLSSLKRESHEQIGSVKEESQP